MNDVKTDALKAAQYLLDPYLVKVLDSIENDYVELWKRAASTEEREDIFYRLRGVKAFRNAFKTKLKDAQVQTHGRDEEINAAIVRIWG